ncbi:DUF2345 domain-containing protein [Curvibacter sp. CHRR-16]|uniref:DUF2345 domain-containing protein n=1 Tax=Curvibacter sp. CHRR-16 TaxID=2835872 RepID=UPI0032EA1972
MTAGGHVSVSTAKSWLVSAKEAIKLFAYKAGIKLVSAKEDIDIQALQKSVNLLAKMDISVTGNVITLTAGDKLTINGAGSQTVWSAAGIHSTTAGSHMAYASNHDQPKGKTQAVSLPSLPLHEPASQYHTALDAGALVATDPQLEKATYEVWSNDPQPKLLTQGQLNSVGHSDWLRTQKPLEVKFIVGDGDWDEVTHIQETDQDN